MHLCKTDIKSGVNKEVLKVRYEYDKTFMNGEGMSGHLFDAEGHAIRIIFFSPHKKYFDKILKDGETYFCKGGYFRVPNEKYSSDELELVAESNLEFVVSNEKIDVVQNFIDYEMFRVLAERQRFDAMLHVVISFDLSTTTNGEQYKDLQIYFNGDKSKNKFILMIWGDDCLKSFVPGDEIEISHVYKRKRNGIEILETRKNNAVKILKKKGKKG